MANVPVRPRDDGNAQQSNWMIPVLLVLLLIALVLVATFVAVGVYATGQKVDNPLYQLWAGTRPI